MARQEIQEGLEMRIDTVYLKDGITYNGASWHKGVVTRDQHGVSVANGEYDRSPVWYPLSSVESIKLNTGW